MQRKETNSEFNVMNVNDEFIPSVQAAKTQGCHKCTKTYRKQNLGISNQYFPKYLTHNKLADLNYIWDTCMWLNGSPRAGWFTMFGRKKSISFKPLFLRNLPEGRGKLRSVTAVQYLSTNWKNITSRSVPRNDLQQIGDVQSYYSPAVMPFCKVKDQFLQTEI